MNPLARHPSFSDATIAEAVRLIEEAGPLDDAQAMRGALALPGTPAAQQFIVERARVLGRRIGLVDEWERGRALAPWILLALVAVIALAGLGLAGSVLGGEARRINVMVALASLLGLHLLTLLLWLLGLVLPLASFQLSFGWLWAALTARVAGGRRGQAPMLLRAMTRLLARARLLPWAIGLASHAIWTLSFAVALAAMLFALAFRNYQLNWETTILDPDFFAAGVQLLGRAPAWLGFPVPDREAVLAPLAAASAQRAWALWLAGCLVVYGLLPRLFCALLCAAICRSRRSALTLDLSQPYYRRLLARFEAMAPRQIVDADPGPIAASAGAAHGALAQLPAAGSDQLVAVAFELPDEFPWPPPDAEFVHSRALRVDGSAGAQRELLDLLARTRPRQLLIGCRAAASPDRGTERFLRDVAALAGQCRLRLIGAAAEPGSAGADAPAHSRWQTWLADTGLAALLVEDRPAALLDSAG